MNRNQEGTEMKTYFAHVRLITLVATVAAIVLVALSAPVVAMLFVIIGLAVLWGALTYMRLREFSS